MDREKIQAVIVAALRRSGLNPYRAAVAAGLPADAIRHLIAGHEPKAGRLAQICTALGLEFYVGPPRVGADVSEVAALPPGSLRDLEASARTLNRVLADAGRNPVPDELWPALAARREGRTLAAESGDLSTDSTGIEVIEFRTATSGADRPEREDFEGKVWFARNWLEKRSLDPTRCALVRVGDQSMEPTLPDGCLILFDRGLIDWLPQRIFVVRTGDDLVAKRAAYSESGEPLMKSDHPAWPDTPLPPGAEIMGQVRWMAYGFD